MPRLGLLFGLVLLSLAPGRVEAASCLDDSDCRVLDEGGGACGGVMGYCLYPSSYECATRAVAPQPEGTPCPDDGDACTADLCDAGGRCAHVPIDGCEPPPDCAIDADCAYMNESRGCSTTQGSCVAGTCTLSTTELCTAPGSGSASSGCTFSPRAPASSAGFMVLLWCTLLLLRRQRGRASRCHLLNN